MRDFHSISGLPAPSLSGSQAEGRLEDTPAPGPLRVQCGRGSRLVRSSPDSPGEVPERDRRTQAGHFQPGRQTPALVVFGPENVVVALDGSEDAFKTGAVPIPRLVCSAGLRVRRCSLCLHGRSVSPIRLDRAPSRERLSLSTLRADAVHFEILPRHVDEADRDVVQHVAQHVRDVSRADRQVTVVCLRVRMAVADEVLDAVHDGDPQAGGVRGQLVLVDETTFAPGIELKH